MVQIKQDNDSRCVSLVRCHVDYLGIRREFVRPTSKPRIIFIFPYQRSSTGRISTFQIHSLTVSLHLVLSLPQRLPIFGRAGIRYHNLAPALLASLPVFAAQTVSRPPSTRSLNCLLKIFPLGFFGIASMKTTPPVSCL